MKCPRAVLFDLDDTLAESFKAPTPEMIERLKRLLELRPIAIVTAAGYQRLETLFLEHLAGHPRLSDFYIFPNSATQCYIWNGSLWEREYDEELTESERAQIASAMRAAAAETDVLDERYEPQVIDRGAQVAFAFLGLEAPLEAKKAWDPDLSKRTRLLAAISKRIPQLDSRIGGMTTIDVTKHGINKSYGVRWLSERLKIPASEMLFIGDALYEGGNDAVVIPTGIQTRSVADPAETLTVIDELLKDCAA